MKYLCDGKKLQKRHIVTGIREDDTAFELEWEEGWSHSEMKRQATALGATRTEYKGLVWDEQNLSYFDDMKNQRFVAIDANGNEQEISPTEMAYRQIMQAVNSGL